MGSYLNKVIRKKKFLGRWHLNWDVDGEKEAEIPRTEGRAFAAEEQHVHSLSLRWEIEGSWYTSGRGEKTGSDVAEVGKPNSVNQSKKSRFDSKLSTEHFLLILNYIHIFIYLFIYFFFFFSFYSSTCGLGVKSELQLQPPSQTQQHQIWATPAPYAAACGNSRSLTFWARPGIKTCVLTETMLGP